MRSFAAYIGNGCHDVGGQFVLDIKVPLLNVGPYLFRGDGDNALRELPAKGSTHIRVTGCSYVAVNVESAADILLCGVLYQRRRAFERGGNGFVAVRVFEENTITAADRCLAITPRIPGKADARRRVE